MSQTKTKRILWTIAVAVALSFATATVLHTHHEPKVIGNISPKDVSAISKLALKEERDVLKEEMHILFLQREYRAVMRKCYRYIFVKVFTIQAIDRQTARVAYGTDTNQDCSNLYVKKAGGFWN